MHDVTAKKLTESAEICRRLAMKSGGRPFCITVLSFLPSLSIIAASSFAEYVSGGAHWERWYSCKDSHVDRPASDSPAPLPRRQSRLLHFILIFALISNIK
jgi:hypothetical protein